MKKIHWGLMALTFLLATACDEKVMPPIDNLEQEAVQLNSITHGEYQMGYGANILENCNYRYYDTNNELTGERHVRGVKKNWSVGDFSTWELDTNMDPANYPCTDLWARTYEKDAANPIDLESGRIVRVVDNLRYYQKPGDLSVQYYYKGNLLDYSVVYQLAAPRYSPMPWAVEKITTYYNYGNVADQKALVGITKKQQYVDRGNDQEAWQQMSDEVLYQDVTLTYGGAYQDRDAVMPELLRMLGLDLYPLVSHRQMLEGKLGVAKLLFPAALQVACDQNTLASATAEFHAHQAPYTSEILRVSENNHQKCIRFVQKEVPADVTTTYLDVFDLTYHERGIEEPEGEKFPVTN